MPYANGCRDCGGTTDGTTRCASCRKARRKAAAAIRTARREQGLCLVCGAAVAKSKLSGGVKLVREASAYCPGHLAYYRQRT